MKENLKQWKHMFKLDPDREITDEALERLCLSGTDAILVGGSSGVTFENTVDLLSRVRRFEVPCLCEISALDAVVPGFDLYMIPSVLNTADGRWITGHHHDALRRYGAILDWDMAVPEGYVIFNEASTAAKVTGAEAPRDEKDVIAYARLADKLFRFPVFYMEYSGMFGNMEWVRQARTVLGEARLFYGGGIDSAAKAREASQAADTIVVGNVIYDNLQEALATVITGMR